ncbi:hypothetical protein MASR2M41_08290 [Flammeovirgaceae bacterium]
MKKLGSVTFINNYYLYHVAMGKILGKKNKFAPAIKHFKKAITLTNHQPEKKYTQNLIVETRYSN